MVFASTVPVTSRPPLSSTSDLQVAGVIVLNIEAVEVVPGLPCWKTNGAKITYGFAIYAPQGEQLASWHVSGTAQKQRCPSYWRPPSVLVETMELAMQDAAIKFIQTFRAIPEVRKWLQEFKG